MLHLKVDKSTDELKYVCRSCSTMKNIDAGFNPCVHKTNYGGNEKIFYEMFINKYTFFDPTLPRSINIHCPFCKNKDSEVIYVRYNDEDMKYIYLCCDCKKAWTNPEYQKHELVFIEK
jgi:DNA-directed RNA polymerase subunit M/transcription elongation factor TFIIS